MRRPIIAGNWKMNKTIDEAAELVVGLKRQLYTISEVDIVVCPPFTALSQVSKLLIDSNISLGAQDMHWEEEGAYTGEVSAGMLKNVGCRYVIIGHSERRQYFGETNETVNKKIKTAICNGLIPIVCVGERLEEQDKGLTLEVIREQIENGLKKLSREEVSHIIIAYEPVWAIGTGRNATAQQAQEAQHFIRELLGKLYDTEIASRIRLQYGGSVKPEIIAQFIVQEDIDGALVGGASLDVDSFAQIVKNAIL